MAAARRKIQPNPLDGPILSATNCSWADNAVAASRDQSVSKPSLFISKTEAYLVFILADSPWTTRSKRTSSLRLLEQKTVVQTRCSMFRFYRRILVQTKRPNFKMDKRSLALVLMSDYVKPDEVETLLAFSVVGRPLQVLLNLDQLSDSNIFEWFRFPREDLPGLLNALQVPKVNRLENGSRFDGMEALCVFLRRLAHLNRYTDMKHIFGRSKPELSMIFT